MKFADLESRGVSSRARVHDLSSTGLSFIVDTDETPMTGDVLKIEFDVPGRKQIAWFATVVRIEQRTEWDPELGDRTFTLVGLRFRQLPAPFRNAIQSSVGGKITGDEKLLNPGTGDRSLPAMDPRSAMAFAALTALVLALFFFMAHSPARWFQFFKSIFQ